MIKNKNILSILLLLGIFELGKAEPVSFQENIAKVKWIESSAKSREIASTISNISNSDLALLTKHTLEVGNIDLLEALKKNLEKENWDKNRSWEEGLEVANIYAETFEVLGKWNSESKEKFPAIFLAAPDVPYQRINEWHLGFGFRGLQGVILRVIASHDKENFLEILGLLNEDSISNSKKRTIVWAMRYDKSGASERLLRSDILFKAGVPRKEIEESLSALESEATAGK